MQLGIDSAVEFSASVHALLLDGPPKAVVTINHDGEDDLASTACCLRTTGLRGIDWLVTAHAAFNVVQKIWVLAVVALLGEAQQVLSERNLAVSNDIDLLQAQRVFESMHELLAGADAAQEGIDDWNELWANAIVKTQTMPRNLDAEPKPEDEWTAFVKMKAATLSMCTQQVLKDIMEKKGWHADGLDSKETLVGKLTTHLVADAKLKGQASYNEMVLLHDNFSASLDSPEDQEHQDVKASIAAALQSDSANRGNSSKCGKYLRVEHTIHAWGSSIAFLFFETVKRMTCTCKVTRMREVT